MGPVIGLLLATFFATPGLAGVTFGNRPFATIENTLSVRTIALRSTTPFRKWRGALTRVQATSNNPTVDGKTQWQRLTARIGALPVRERLSAVNYAFNRIAYGKDTEIWGRRDYWASPQEFLARGRGDCEDYAIAKFFTLRALGVSADRLFILTYQDFKIGAAHTVLMVREGQDWIVLDNRRRMPTPLAYYAFIKPLYILNESSAWWLIRN